MLFERLQDPIVLTIVRWMLAVVFFGAGLSKVADPKRFVEVVLSYRILPTPVARWYARVLPWMELSIGAGLLVGIATTIAAGVSAMLLCSFVVAIAVNLMRGRTELSCGCFGSKYKKKINGWLIARNSMLIVASIYVATFAGGSFERAKQPIAMAQEVTSAPSIDVVIITAFLIGGFSFFYLIARSIYALHNRYR